MRFITMVNTSEATLGEPPEAVNGAMARLREEAAKTGVVFELGGLLSSANGARVRLSGGRVTVTDGPFAEAKEVIGGYATFRAKSKAEALDWTVRFIDTFREHWPEWEGEVELRQLMEVGAPA